MMFQRKCYWVVIGLVFLLSTAVMAENPFEDGPYPLGWWDAMGPNENPSLIAGHGGNFVVAYGGNKEYLDTALAAGVRVVMNMPWSTPESEVLALVNLYKDHPALVGFNIVEETWYAEGLTLPPVQARYDAIKLLSDKPVFICFTEYALNVKEHDPVIAVAWKSAYDQFLVDVYPTRIGGAEFSRLENEGRGKDFKNDMIRAEQTSVAADKPWWAVLSGWGNDTDDERDYRLPTYDESRFATYWSLSENAAGILHFAYYRTGHGRAPARPDEPYPHDGEQWLIDVHEPQTAELNKLGPALKGGKIDDIVNDDTANVRSDVYHDPDTDEYYLVTLNSTAGNPSTTFTINLPEAYDTAVRLFEGEDGEIALVNGQFTDSFTDYEVHVYLLSK
jgi:hypothetical protein